MRHFIAAVCVLILMLGGSAAAAFQPIADGILYHHETPPGRSIHVLEVDLCRTGLRFQATGPHGGTQTVSRFASRLGAVAAINGGHANEKYAGPTGPAAHDGVFFGGPDADDFGQVVFGNKRVRFIDMQTPFVPSAWMKEVVSGLLTLVHEGRPLHDKLPHGSYPCKAQHPRTLIGMTADRRTLLMVVIDGRRPERGMTGMTCAEAADYMVSLGAYWALNLDGGGSSTMWLGGRVVNSPSDGRERPVGSHLALVPNAAATGYCRFDWLGDVLPLLLEE